METVAPPTPTASPGIFGTKIPASIAFLAGVLLFLLPFAEVRCNGTPLANNTGLGIAMGSEWRPVDTNLRENDGTADDFKSEKQDPNVFAIAGLALGVIGLLIVFLDVKGSKKAGLLLGLLSASALIGMLIDLKSKANNNSSVKPTGTNLVTGIKVTVDATGWFYLALIAFLLAAVFCWQRGKQKLSGNKE